MSIFDDLVDVAIENKRELAPLRVVVEKELLHHDILRVLSRAGLLEELTFIGGTCLRACYGSNRLSEDLDFTGGRDFTKDQLAQMADVLIESIRIKYGLEVKVSYPVREEGNVDRWKIHVQTRPGRKDLPAQGINIDVCAIPSYEPRPMMLLNSYGVDMGTSGLIVQAQSKEEIFADKLIAFAMRPNRIKNRDLWDIAWLHQLQIKPSMQWIPEKLQDHRVGMRDYLSAFKARVNLLDRDIKIKHEFRQEMARFLPHQMVQETVNTDRFWEFLVALMFEYNAQLVRAQG